jgi:hypothetical protein
MLPKLRTAPAFSAHHSTHGTLPTMSCLPFPSLLFYWMLVSALAPLLPLVSRQAIFIRTPDLQLVLVGFLVVQSIQSTHLMADLTWQRALNPKWSGTFLRRMVQLD